MIRWEYNGVVTGSESTFSKYGCKLEPLNPDQPDNKTCETQLGGHCNKNCNNPDYRIPYEDDKHYAEPGSRFAVLYPTAEQIQREIFLNGPVVTSFDIYEDFKTYDGGADGSHVYKHTTGKLEGGHGIRILGWGEENGTPYWLIANSFGSSWGLRGETYEKDGRKTGVGKFIRGTNDCNVEQLIVGALPLKTK